MTSTTVTKLAQTTLSNSLSLIPHTASTVANSFKDYSFLSNQKSLNIATYNIMSLGKTIFPDFLNIIAELKLKNSEVVQALLNALQDRVEGVRLAVGKALSVII